MKNSPTRSVVESRNAPKTVDLPPARASAPSRMSRIEPATKTVAPSQKKSSSLRPSKRTMTEATKQSVTPVTVSASGVTRVRASPEIERVAMRRAPVVQLCLIAAALVTRVTVAASSARDPGGSAGGRLRSLSGKNAHDLALVDDRQRDECDRDAGDAVEPEVVSGGHHDEPLPGRPDRPEELRPPVPADECEHDPD